MTRTEVARRLEVTEAGVRKMVQRRELPEHEHTDGRARYDAADVAAIEERRALSDDKRVRRGPKPAIRRLPDADGALAARAYELLDGGADRRKLVRELQVDPEVAERFFTLYHQQGDAFAISHVTAETVARKLRVEPFATDAGLVEAVERTLARLADETARKLAEKDAFIERLEGTIEKLEHAADVARDKLAKAEIDLRKARGAEEAARKSASEVAATVTAMFERAAATAISGAGVNQGPPPGTSPSPDPSTPPGPASAEVAPGAPGPAPEAHAVEPPPRR